MLHEATIKIVTFQNDERCEIFTHGTVEYGKITTKISYQDSAGAFNIGVTSDSIIINKTGDYPYSLISIEGQQHPFKSSGLPLMSIYTERLKIKMNKPEIKVLMFYRLVGHNQSSIPMKMILNCKIKHQTI